MVYGPGGSGNHVEGSPQGLSPRHQVEQTENRGTHLGAQSSLGLNSSLREVSRSIGPLPLSYHLRIETASRPSSECSLVILVSCLVCGYFHYLGGLDELHSTGLSRADSFIKLSIRGNRLPPDLSKASHPVSSISFRNGSTYSW